MVQWELEGKSSYQNWADFPDLSWLTVWRPRFESDLVTVRTLVAEAWQTSEPQQKFQEPQRLRGPKQSCSLQVWSVLEFRSELLSEVTFSSPATLIDQLFKLKPQPFKFDSTDSTTNHQLWNFNCNLNYQFKSLTLHYISIINSNHSHYIISIQLSFKFQPRR